MKSLVSCTSGTPSRTRTSAISAEENVHSAEFDAKVDLHRSDQDLLRAAYELLLPTQPFLAEVIRLKLLEADKDQ